MFVPPNPCLLFLRLPGCLSQITVSFRAKCHAVKAFWSDIQPWECGNLRTMRGWRGYSDKSIRHRGTSTFCFWHQYVLFAFLCPVTLIVSRCSRRYIAYFEATWYIICGIHYSRDLPCIPSECLWVSSIACRKPLPCDSIQQHTIPCFLCDGPGLHWS